MTVHPQIRVWGILFCNQLLSSFCCSVLFCVWGSRDFALPLQDYTSAFLVFSLLTIICQSRYFRVSFVFLGRFWNQHLAAVTRRQCVSAQPVCAAAPGVSWCAAPLLHHRLLHISEAAAAHQPYSRSCVLRRSPARPCQHHEPSTTTKLLPLLRTATAMHYYAAC